MAKKILRNLPGISLALCTLAYSQFLDAVLEISIHNQSEVIRINDSFIATEIVKIPDSTMELSGAAILMKTTGLESVSFIIDNENKQDNSSQEIHFFPEPFSNRTIVVFRNQKPFNTSQISFKVISSSQITILSFGIFKADNNDTYSESISRPLSPRVSGIDKPEVISREEWNAKPPKNNYSFHPYFNKLTLHHAAGWQAWTIEEGKQQVKAIQEFHQEGRGWSDIGYHFLVDLAGNIYQGRPEIVIGAHVGGANTGNIGVCMLGCYHPPETGWPCYDTMTKDTENALTHLYAWISDTYKVDPNVLLGHRDYFGTTVCPGDNVWPLITGMRENISIFIASGGPPDTFSLLPNYPNPFNAMTTIPFRINGGQPVRVVITDLLGREITSVEKQNTMNGYNQVNWYGNDYFGLRVPAGLYLYTIEVGEEKKSGKMVYLK